jgi:hypothetical protein
MMPLLTAVVEKASSDVIEMLIKACPKAVEVQNKLGKPPIAYA